MEHLSESELERRFAETIDNVNLIAVQLDKNGCISYCNKFMTSLFGWSEEELLGADWFEKCLPESDRVSTKNFFNEIINGKSEILAHHENMVLLRNGETRIISWNNVVMKDRSGEIIGTSSIGEDITKLKTTEKELFEKMEELKKMNKIMIGREERVIELKEEIKRLKG